MSKPDPFEGLTIGTATKDAEDEAVKQVKLLGGEIGRLVEKTMQAGEVDTLELMLERVKAVADGTDTGDNPVELQGPKERVYPVFTASGHPTGTGVREPQAIELGLIATLDGSGNITGYTQPPKALPAEGTDEPKSKGSDTPETIPLYAADGSRDGDISVADAIKDGTIDVTYNGGTPKRAQRRPVNLVAPSPMPSRVRTRSRSRRGGRRG